MKRVIDFTGALAALVVLAPLLLLLSLLVKCDSAGPVFFRQERVGRGMRRFRLWKFRSMRHDPGDRGPQLTVGGDARITRVGAFLRRTKLDELPQLLNVLRGDMSFVGPRPEVPRYVELFPEDFREILRVRPGVTDPASLHYRNESALLSRAADPEREYVERILPNKIRLARNYVNGAPWWVDLVVVLKTVFEAVGMEAVPKAGAGIRLSRFAVWVTDIACIVAAYVIAWQLRFDADVPAVAQPIMWRHLPWLVAIRAAVFAAFRVHRGLWRYAGMSDYARIVAAVLVSSAAAAALVRMLPGGTGHPWSVFVIDSLLLITFAAGARALRRGYHDATLESPGTRVLVYGTGDTAETTVRVLRKSGEYLVVGLLDNDPLKKGVSIHGVPVLGGIRDVRRIVEDTAAAEVIFAMAYEDPELLQDLQRVLQPMGVRVTARSYGLQ